MKVEEAISQEFLRAHPVEAARALDVVAVEDMVALLGASRPNAVATVLQNMEPFRCVKCMLVWSDELVREVLASLPVSFIARILRLLDTTDRERMLKLLSADRVRVLRALLTYPEGTAGSWMRTLYAAYPQDLVVGETLRRLRRLGKRSGFYIYILDPEGVLVGALSLQDLVSADRRQSMKEIMSTPVESIPVHASVRTILEHPAWSRFPDLPVVDEAGVLLGLIRYSFLKKLEIDKGGESPRVVLHIALALGELYWSGAFHLFRGLADTVRSVSPGILIEEKSDEY